MPTGKTSQYTKSIIAGAVVNLIVNLFTIPKWLGAGACIGSICAEFTVTFTQWLFIRKDVKIHALDTAIKSIVAAFVMGVCIYFIGNVMGARILTNMVQALVGIIVYCIVLLLLKEKTVSNLFSKLVLKAK